MWIDAKMTKSKSPYRGSQLGSVDISLHHRLTRVKQWSVRDSTIFFSKRKVSTFNQETGNHDHVLLSLFRNICLILNHLVRMITSATINFYFKSYTKDITEIMHHIKIPTHGRIRALWPCLVGDLGDLPRKKCYRENRWVLSDGKVT